MASGRVGLCPAISPQHRRKRPGSPPRRPYLCSVARRRVTSLGATDGAPPYQKAARSSLALRAGRGAHRQVSGQRRGSAAIAGATGRREAVRLDRRGNGGRRGRATRRGRTAPRGCAGHRRHGHRLPQAMTMAATARGQDGGGRGQSPTDGTHEHDRLLSTAGSRTGAEGTIHPGRGTGVCFSRIPAAPAEACHSSPPNGRPPTPRRRPSPGPCSEWPQPCGDDAVFTVERPGPGNNGIRSPGRRAGPRSRAAVGRARTGGTAWVRPVSATAPVRRLEGAGPSV